MVPMVIDLGHAWQWWWAMMSASRDPPGVTHDLLEYLKAKSIREESVWGRVRNRSEAQNGVCEPPTHLLIRCALVIPTATWLTSPFLSFDRLVGYNLRGNARPSREAVAAVWRLPRHHGRRAAAEAGEDGALAHVDCASRMLGMHAHARPTGARGRGHTTKPVFRISFSFLDVAISPPRRSRPGSREMRFSLF